MITPAAATSAAPLLEGARVGLFSYGARGYVDVDFRYVYGDTTAGS